MINKNVFATLALCVTAFSTYANATPILDPYDMHGAPEHIQFRKDHGGAPHQATGSSALLTYHSGTVFHSSQTAVIFWGSSWQDSNFAGDKITGLDSFFDGFAGSNYSRTATEYYDKTGQISTQSTYLGHMIDSSAAPMHALKSSSAVAEVCKVTNNAPAANTLYLIYTSTGAGNVNYCAWHSWGTCANGAQVQVAYMPNLDGIAGCDPVDTSGLHSQGLAALANVTAHELLETITDPRGQGWYDASGQEDGDKCAWSFPTGDGLSTLYNGSKWKLQMEWSNAAYQAGTGLPNRSGQKACIY